MRMGKTGIIMNCDIYGYILFSDGSWLERREYDGAEWWKFMTLPTKESIEDYINSRK